MKCLKQPESTVILRNISLRSHNHPRLSFIIDVKVTLSGLVSWSTIRKGGRAGAWAGHVHMLEELTSLPIDPSEDSSALPITEPKFLSFFLIDALAEILTFQCNSTSNILFSLLTFLIFYFLKKQNSSSKCGPREEKLFSKGRHTCGIKRKCLGQRGTANQGMEAADSP